MSLHVLDTDTLSLYQHGLAVVCEKVDAYLPADLAITVLSVEEQLSGWYTQLRRAKRPGELATVYERLTRTVRSLARLTILSFTEAAIARYEELRALKLNIGKMDLRIAAIVLEAGAVLVTRNLRDFQLVPHLVVADWSR